MAAVVIIGRKQELPPFNHGIIVNDRKMRLYLPNPSSPSRMRHKVNFSNGLNLKFSFSQAGYHTKFKETVWPTIDPLLSREKARDSWFFANLLPQCKIQTASSRIWTCVAEFISKDKNLLDDEHLTKKNDEVAYSRNSHCFIVEQQ